MSYDINLKHLEYFIKVARLGSINKAAQMLYVSQSHLGKIIHDLEETVGAPLLNRSRQGVTLTPEGNEFLERSVRILKEMEGMHLRPLKEMEKTEPLAVSMTKFSHVMESFITIVRRYQDQPEFTHRLYEGQLEDVIEDVVSSVYNQNTTSSSLFFDKRTIDITYGKVVYSDVMRNAIICTFYF